jgi:hypothetical protein
MSTIPMSTTDIRTDVVGGMQTRARFSYGATAPIRFDGSGFGSMEIGGSWANSGTRLDYSTIAACSTAGRSAIP